MLSLKDFLKNENITIKEIDSRIICNVKKDYIKDFIKKLTEIFQQKFYLSCISGVDYIQDEIFELDYMFWFFDEKKLLILKVPIPRKNPVINSILDIIPAAIPYEQEIYDLMGIKFDGNPYLRKGFFVPSTMVNACPLRKDWKGVKK